MTRFFLLIAILVSSVSCAPKHEEFVRYKDSGLEKPIVVFLPIIDRSAHSLAWDLSQELSEGILQKMREQGQLYVSEEDRLFPISKNLGQVDLMSRDISSAINFQPAEFVVVSEILEHRTVPYKRGEVKPLYATSGKGSSVLKMTLHLKVIDIRSSHPRPILQEVFSSNHMISEKGDEVSYERYPWGSKRYANTPFAAAHARVERDIAQRVERYVNYAKR